jgi:hypothetical protein
VNSLENKIKHNANLDIQFNLTPALCQRKVPKATNIGAPKEK